MIERLEDDEFVKVFYVDYGTRAIIPLKNCRYLHNNSRITKLVMINYSSNNVANDVLQVHDAKRGHFQRKASFTYKVRLCLSHLDPTSHLIA